MLCGTSWYDETTSLERERQVVSMAEVVDGCLVPQCCALRSGGGFGFWVEAGKG